MWKTSGVSIPYRQTINVSVVWNCAGMYVSFNSLQVDYQLGVFCIFQSDKPYVSIPYRQTINGGYGRRIDFADIKFQFLIGRLSTKEATIVKNICNYLFQFLIGRLSTRALSSAILAGTSVSIPYRQTINEVQAGAELPDPKFQFLIGRLSTEEEDATLRTMEQCFNSLQVDYQQS